MTDSVRTNSHCIGCWRGGDSRLSTADVGGAYRTAKNNRGAARTDAANGTTTAQGANTDGLGSPIVGPARWRFTVARLHQSDTLSMSMNRRRPRDDRGDGHRWNAPPPPRRAAFSAGPRGSERDGLFLDASRPVWTSMSASRSPPQPVSGWSWSASPRKSRSTSSGSPA